MWDSKRPLRNDPLSTLPARREKKLRCGTLQHFFNTFLKINTEKNGKKPSVWCWRNCSCCDPVCEKVSARLHPLSAHGYSSLSWVIFLHSSPWLSLLKQPSQAQQQPLSSPGWIVHSMDFSLLNDGLWITDKSGMFCRALQHQKGSQYRRNSLPEGQGSNYRGSCWIWNPTQTSSIHSLQRYTRRARQGSWKPPSV